MHLLRQLVARRLARKLVGTRLAALLPGGWLAVILYPLARRLWRRRAARMAEPSRAQAF